MQSSNRRRGGEGVFSAPVLHKGWIAGRDIHSLGRGREYRYEF